MDEYLNLATLVGALLALLLLAVGAGLVLLRSPKKEPAERQTKLRLYKVSEEGFLESRKDVFEIRHANSSALFPGVHIRLARSHTIGEIADEIIKFTRNAGEGWQTHVECPTTGILEVTATTVVLHYPLDPGEQHVLFYELSERISKTPEWQRLAKAYAAQPE